MKTVNLFLLFYDTAWTVAVILSLPLAPFLKKWRYPERLGAGAPSIRSERKRIWIHALSVGEVISAIPVVRALREQYPSRELILTVKTSQGMKIAGIELKGDVDFLLPMPFDFWWSVKRFIDRINPSVFVLVETDMWPGLINALHKKGVRIFLVNGRISPKTYRCYSRFSFITGRIFRLLDKCLMQSDLDRDRLIDIGVPADLVETAGNIKYDRAYSPMDEEERRHWFNELRLRHGDRLWVAGSTHEGEEKLILEAFSKISRSFPELRLLVAPRRIERSEAILKTGRCMGLDISMRTDIREGYRVLVLNTLGELSRVYGLADISFVGGSLVPVGGHNLLEPAVFGCPVIFGPYTQNFVLMAQALEQAGGGIRITEEKISDVVSALLQDLRRLKDMGTKARGFVEMNKGALDRVMEHIGRYI